APGGEPADAGGALRGHQHGLPPLRLRVLDERALHARPGDLDDRRRRRLAHLEPPGRCQHRPRLPRAASGFRARASGDGNRPYRPLAGPTDPSLSGRRRDPATVRAPRNTAPHGAQGIRPLVSAALPRTARGYAPRRRRGIDVALYRMRIPALSQRAPATRLFFSAKGIEYSSRRTV